MRNRLRLTVLIGILISSAINVHAQETPPERPRLTPSNWARGFHFFPGAGVNTALFNSNIENVNVGWGMSLRADTGYYFTNDFATELSSSVNFNRVDGYLLWDNQFTLGFRFRMPYLIPRDNFGPYARVFVGRGPLVLVFERRKPPPYEGTGSQRLQLEGPVYGGGVGIMQTTTDNSVWFMELMITSHVFESIEVISSEKDVPVIISQSTLSDKSTFSTLHLLIGIVAF